MVNKNYRAFAMVMAANVEALVIMFMAHQGALYLDENHPMSFEWRKITYLAGVVVIGVLWFRMFSHLVKQASKSEEHESDEFRSSS